MAIAAVGNNLITYVFNEMHFSLSKSANIVTNFVGTIFLLSLLGGFLSDSYLGSFWTMLIFGFVELSGFILLAVQAHLPQLRPPQCNMMSKEEHCLEAKGFKATIFFIALYLVALGSGCMKPNMIAHGADQFRKDDPKQSKKLSTYFNTAYFSFCVGELIALTLLVWVQTRSGMDVGFGVSAAAMAVGLISLVSGLIFYRNKPPQGSMKKLSTYFNTAYFSFCVGELVALTLLVWVQTRSGMDVGFGVSAAAMAMGLISLVSGLIFYRNKPPQGSIFTPIARVFVAAIAKRKQVCPSSSEMLHQRRSNAPGHLIVSGLRRTDKFRFLDKACIKCQDGSSMKESPWKLCTITEVEQVKIILSVIPIFACTIIFNTVLAQLQTFSVQQGSAMNTKLTKSFHIPPASLQAIPYIILIVLVPIYDMCFVPLARRLTGKESGITPLQRIGVGLCTVTFSMVAAALVEKKRREVAIGSNKLLSIFWMAPQFLIFGLSEMFTAVGLIEFFYKQSLYGMQSFLTAMTYCSYSFGFFLSSLLVSLVNKITSSSSKSGWLSDNDLNKDRLDYFYWLLAALSLLNFFNYLYWSTWYPSNPSLSTTAAHGSYGEEDHLSFSSSKHVEADN
ncbi:protein NRT1/ PTR FAMILY 4.3 [Cocos nucifera]|uniref:Protein NRT1/ PTR FAMILY 4.3 n=1 Tax=Cocos nucifera TaxID=13894 RepID=A0A8K0HZR0_COCNU|nr:protein NRT1/ PTR FAMILY 4.3 [Cocos nucifera]